MWLQKNTYGEGSQLEYWLKSQLCSSLHIHTEEGRVKAWAPVSFNHKLKYILLSQRAMIILSTQRSFVCVCNLEYWWFTLRLYWKLSPFFICSGGSTGRSQPTAPEQHVYPAIVKLSGEVAHLLRNCFIVSRCLRFVPIWLCIFLVRAVVAAVCYLLTESDFVKVPNFWRVKRLFHEIIRSTRRTRMRSSFQLQSNLMQNLLLSSNVFNWQCQQ